jgi:hypothetical protein
MKTLLSYILIVAFVASNHLAAAQHSIGDLAGRWETSDGGSGTIEFQEGNKVVVSISGMQVPATNYTIDFSKSPIWFDVFVAQSKTVKGLLEFEDDDTIKWQIFLSGDRGYDFSDSEGNPVLVFKRKK